MDIDIASLIDQCTASRIASAMGEKVPTVCNWRHRGVPEDKAVRFCAAVEWKVTPHQVAPRLYPYPDDALPAHLRSATPEGARP